MKRIPPLTVTPVTVMVVRHGDHHFVNILAVSCGERNVYLRVGNLVHAQRYRDNKTRVSTWVVTNDLHWDYIPFPAELISEKTIKEVGKVEDGPAALEHILDIAVDCPAVRDLLEPIFRLFR